MSQKKMKRVLFPTDFSDNARHAIYYGLQLLEGETCKCLFFNTFNIQYTSPEVPLSMSEVVSENADKSFKDLLEQINKDFPGHHFEFETDFRIGAVDTVASTMARHEKADLIIMGTEGASGFAETLAGSRTSTVIKWVDCPVLAIPEGSQYQPPKRIALALAAHKYPLSAVALSPLIDIARKFHSEVLLVHVTKNNEVPSGIAEQAGGLLEGIDHSFHTVHHKSITAGIEEFARQHRPHMLAMITHKPALFENLFHRSITRKMSLYSKIPLLAMHA